MLQLSSPAATWGQTAAYGVALDGVTQAMAEGAITPQEAEAVANVLGARRRALVAIEGKPTPGKLEIEIIGGLANAAEIAKQPLPSKPGESAPEPQPNGAA